MNDNQNWNTIGDQIKGAVQDALDSGDFRQLNDMVAGTVNSALSEAKRQVKMAAEDVKMAAKDVKEAGKDAAEGFRPGAGRYGGPGFNGQNGMPGGNGWYGGPRDTFHYRRRYDSRSRNGWYGSPRNGAAGNAGNGAQGNPGNGVPGNPGTSVRNFNNALVSRIKTRKVGRVAGTLYMVFGGIGTGLMGLGLLAFLILLAANGASAVISVMAVLSGVLLFAFLIMIERGCVKKERLKRAQRYVTLCNGNTYINIEDLAMHMGKSTRFILKDVKKMLKLGIFPEGHLDQKESCLMLDDATYREYLSLEKQRKVQEIEARVAAMKDKKAGKQPQQEVVMSNAVQENQEASQVIQNPELEAMIGQGQDFIRRLRDMNDNIEGEVISAKLFQLENLLKEIFDRVKEHPEQMPQMQKFMNYYLPTTLKLVQAYEEFDSVSAPGEDIVSAKAEIEKTLDTINKAFVELLNNLFRDSVFDVTTDAQVLQTMLVKEGLTKELEMEKVLR